MRPRSQDASDPLGDFVQRQAAADVVLPQDGGGTFPVLVAGEHDAMVALRRPERATRGGSVPPERGVFRGDPPPEGGVEGPQATGSDDCGWRRGRSECR